MTATQGTLELQLAPQALNAVQIFQQGGLDAILEGIEAKVRAIPLDGSTAAGRDQIRSVAYSVTRTKTLLDAEGKALTEGWRESTKRVNDDRKRLTERLTLLADDVRKPLTDFENKDKARVAAHEAALAELTGLLEILKRYPNMTAADLAAHLADYESLHAGRDWEEFTSRAHAARTGVLSTVQEKLAARRQFEADQAELAALRAAEEARLQKERDERLQREAAEKQRLESERKAAAEAERERKRVEAEAEKVRLAAEKDRREHEAAIKKAEADKLAAEAKAKAEVEAAEKRARDAAEQERQRIESERKAQEAADAKRAANKAHVAKVRSEVLEDLLDYVADEALANKLVEILTTGQIRHVKVVF